MLFEAFHNAAGIQKASGFFLDGIQSLCWVFDGLRNNGVAFQVVNHNDDACRNFMDATIETDVIIRAIGNEIKKDMYKRDIIETTKIALNKRKVNTLQKSAVSSEAQKELGEPLRDADLAQCDAYAGDALMREACVLDMRIELRRKVQVELAMIKDVFSNCTINLRNYNMYIGYSYTQELLRDIELTILSLCQLSTHFDNLLGKSEPGIVSQQVRELLDNISRIQREDVYIV